MEHLAPRERLPPVAGPCGPEPSCLADGKIAIGSLPVVPLTATIG
ncbi:hypothetical protein [Streptomyces sp. NPDC059788]